MMMTAKKSDPQSVGNGDNFCSNVICLLSYTDNDKTVFELYFPQTMLCPQNENENETLVRVNNCTSDNVKAVKHSNVCCTFNMSFVSFIL